ncbi:MAG: DUF1919 domain-containing protein [Lachnospiraceae bacterium]|nr:DUF1919 domain-containing protein [Lachnospiraceae bacterium]
MFKVVFWGVGQDYNKYFNNIQREIEKKNIMCLGITAREKLFNYIDGIPFIMKEEIIRLDFDYLIIANEVHFKEIKNEAIEMGIENSKIINISVFSIPYFDFKKYVRVREADISILSRNCFAGILYHYLQMQFRSPFINMFMTGVDFNKLVKNSKKYLDSELYYIETRHGNIVNMDYPVCALNDITLYMNHYSDFESAADSFYRRVKRVNLSNVYYVATAHDEDVIEEFLQIDVPNKLLITNRFVDVDYAVCLHLPDEDYVKMAISMARGNYPCIDFLAWLSGDKDYIRIK